MTSFLAGSVIFLLRAASRAGFLGKERHGYDIMQQVKTDSENAVKMGPGTLCGSLANDGRPNRISCAFEVLGSRLNRKRCVTWPLPFSGHDRLGHRRVASFHFVTTVDD